MANLYQIYADLKKKTGGNRELMHFEHSFGMPKEEQQHITPVPAHIRRMLSQLEYGIRLSEELDHKYDAPGGPDGGAGGGGHAAPVGLHGGGAEDDAHGGGRQEL